MQAPEGTLAFVPPSTTGVGLAVESTWMACRAGIRSSMRERDGAEPEPDL